MDKNKDFDNLYDRAYNKMVKLGFTNGEIDDMFIGSTIISLQWLCNADEKEIKKALKKSK